MTQTQKDIESISRAADGTAYYGQQFVAALNRAHAAVWSLPDERLAAALNAFGAEAVTRLVALHSAAAAGINAALDAAGDTGPRALVEPGREFTVAEDGTITVVPLAEPGAPEEQEE